MNAIAAIADAFWRWLDRVAEAMIALAARVVTPRTVRILEEDNGHFSIVAADTSEAAALRGLKLRVEDATLIGAAPARVEAALRGGRVDLVLRADRFVFKPLELPVRAAEFLDGVVRAQIDRLTPWSAEKAAFGFSVPIEAGPGRMMVTVAATAKTMLAPIVQAFAGSGAHAVTISTRAPEAPTTAPAITIMQDHVAGILSMRMARRILLVALVSCCLLAAIASIAAAVIGDSLAAREDELARRIAGRRAAAVAARKTADDPTAAAERALARRKNEQPSAVIALEVLSRILPDHTYVTELRIEADKLRLTGITRDAPELIRLIEQTKQFTQATFFAPVTPSRSDNGDRFNIEARLKPDFSPTP